MSRKQPFTCRRSPSAKRWAVAMMIAMMLSPIGRPVFQPAVQAQQQVAPVGQGFVIDAEDLRFIYQQILVAQANAAGTPLNKLVQTSGFPFNPQLTMGLRTVDGSFNNPGGLFVDSARRLYVSDTGSDQLQRLDLTNPSAGWDRWGSDDTALGGFIAPASLTGDANGALFVCNRNQLWALAEGATRKTH